MQIISVYPQPSAALAGRWAAILFVGIGAFQVCLASGAPWGRAAYGGAHAGVVPPRLRRSSAVAAGVYCALAAVAGTTVLGRVARRRVLLATAPVMAIGAVLNLASPSLVERLLWTPTTAALSGLLWRAARRSEGPYR